MPDPATASLRGHDTLRQLTDATHAQGHSPDAASGAGGLLGMSPAALASGAIIGLVGVALLRWGKREGSLRHAMAGLSMCVYPMFVTSAVLMWLVFALCLAGVWALGAGGAGWERSPEA